MRGAAQRPCPPVGTSSGPKPASHPLIMQICLWIRLFSALTRRLLCSFADLDALTGLVPYRS